MAQIINVHICDEAKRSDKLGIGKYTFVEQEPGGHNWQVTVLTITKAGFSRKSVVFPQEAPRDQMKAAFELIANLKPDKVLVIMAHETIFGLSQIIWTTLGPKIASPITLLGLAPAVPAELDSAISEAAA